jgi:hypothetical protein
VADSVQRAKRDTCGLHWNLRSGLAEAKQLSPQHREYLPEAGLNWSVFYFWQRPGWLDPWLDRWSCRGFVNKTGRRRHYGLHG